MGVRSLMTLGAVALLFLAGSLASAGSWPEFSRGDCQFYATPEKAIPSCTRLIQSHKLAGKELSDAYAMRASKFDDKGDYGMAIADLGSAIEQTPNDSELYAQRSQVHERNRQFKEAIQDLDTVIKLNPSSVAYSSRGRLFMREVGDYSAALADFNQAEALGANVYSSRGQAFLGLGQYQRAIDDFTAELKLADRPIDSVGGALDRAYAYRANRQYDLAIADYDEALRREPKALMANLGRAMANIEAGRFSSAKADLERAGVKGLLWSYIIEARQGNDDVSRIRAEISNPDLPRDYSPIYELFLGRSTPDRVMAAAAADRWSPRLQTCDSKVFVGEWFLLKKKVAEAAENFKFAAENCLGFGWTLNAVPTAIAELTRLEAEAGQSSAKVSEVEQSGVPAAAKTPPPPAPTQGKALEAVVSLGQSVANQGRRVALVIGNSEYKNVPALANPVHDAEMVAEVLTRTGFESVVLQENLGKDAMTSALRSFAIEAAKADWAVVYYAGHGIEVGGINYLIPVDARLATDRDVDFEAVPLEQVLNAAERAGKLRLVILDACRDNPFKSQMKRTLAAAASRSVSVGLAPVEPDPGTLVVYAAKGGEQASDGNGEHGPFAAAFAKDVLIPGLEVRRLFDFVRDDVLEMTHHEQQPFSYGSISGRQDFYFVAPGKKDG